MGGRNLSEARQDGGRGYGRRGCGSGEFLLVTGTDPFGTRLNGPGGDDEVTSDEERINFHLWHKLESQNQM